MSQEMELFISQIIKNLELNGFPEKKVSFDLVKMYELADSKNLSFNVVLDHLNEDFSIINEKTAEKIIFIKQNEPEINADMFKQAQEMMENMDSDQIEQIKSMYENMSEEEKQNIMNQAKKMGLMG